jgi:cysteinyl-tRNA synthetase
MGLLESDPDEYLKSIAGESGTNEEEIEHLVNERIQAKKDKNWARADEIRNQLNDMGIELEDKGMETSWRRS